MRTFGKLVLATAAALVLTAPVAGASPLNGVGGPVGQVGSVGSSGPLSLVQPVTNLIGLGLLG